MGNAADLLKFDLAELGDLFRRKPDDLPDQDLLAMDFMLHRAWSIKRDGGNVHLGEKSWSFEDMLDLHALVKQTMAARGFKHVTKDELDTATDRLLAEQAAAAAAAPAAKAADQAAPPTAEAQLVGIVLARRGAAGAWSYTYGLDFQSQRVPGNAIRSHACRMYYAVGDTPPDATELEIGDMVAVGYATLDMARASGGVVALSVGGARVAGGNGRPRPMSIGEAVKAARKAGAYLPDNPGHVPMPPASADDGAPVSKAATPAAAFADNPPEGGRYKYVLQSHWRGKTVHHDLRLQTREAGALVGWTLASEIPGVVKDPVETLAAAAEWSRRGDAYKLDLAAGSFKDRRNAAGNVVPAQLRAFPKAVQPAAWLGVEGVTGPWPAPGSTQQFRGVFRIDDAGAVEYGAQKDDSHEYFLHGKMRGRIVFHRLNRSALKAAVDGGQLVPPLGADDTYACMGDLEKLLPPSEGDEGGDAGTAIWTAIKPVDQRPVVLSDGAVKKRWVPPAGVSALPASVRDRVPGGLRYWSETDAAERLAVRDELVAALADGNVKLDFAALVGPTTEK